MRSMIDIRNDIEALDNDLTNYCESGFTPEAQIRRNQLTLELEEWFESN